MRPVRAPNSALGGADARILRSGSSDPKGATAAPLEMFADSFKHPCVKKVFLIVARDSYKTMTELERERGR